MKKSLFSFKHKKRKKSKKDLTKQPLDNDPKDNLKNRYKKIFYKVTETKGLAKDYLKNNYKDKINVIKKFILIIFGYGLIINYSIHFLFGIKFNLFTLFAWGIAYYFIKDEFIEWFRRLIAKR